MRAELEGDQGAIIFEDWQENRWRFEFSGTAFFRTSGLGRYVDSVSVVAESNDIDEALSAIERDGGNRDGYSGLISVTFESDRPIVAVVLERLCITEIRNA